MSDILIRDIDESLDQALKINAARHGRSRDAEIKAILRDAIDCRPAKRSLAEALMDIPQLEADPEAIFARSKSDARPAE